MTNNSTIINNLLYRVMLNDAIKVLCDIFATFFSPLFLKRFIVISLFSQQMWSNFRMICIHQKVPHVFLFNPISMETWRCLMHCPSVFWRKITFIILAWNTLGCPMSRIIRISLFSVSPAVYWLSKGTLLSGVW